MPVIICSVCGRSDDLPPWHPDSEQLKAHHGASGPEPQHICTACADRIRSEAVRQRDAGGPTGLP